MTDVTAKVASGAAGNELLCYCKGTSTAEFAAIVAARPDAALADICQDTGIGLVCTSCLLNAEMLFTRTRCDGTANGTAATKRGNAPTGSRGWRARLAALADRLPRVPERRTSVCPVIAGRGVHTVLNVSNAIPRSIGPHSARFRVRAVVRDAGGQVRGRIARTVAPGERLEVDLADMLASASGDGIAVGTARITLRPLDDRYNGMVRPHFQMLTDHACAAVHTANAASHFAAPHLFSRRRPGERQFVHVHNAEPKTARIRLDVASVAPSAAGIRTIEQTIAPNGSALVEMPDTFDRAGAGPLCSVGVDSTTIQRSYFIVADADFARLSVDHI
ncbi:MAG: hypothetical protein FJX53_16800 [Alphaproteobacteria bacterium]|nr:hypothetical protein [Alphaproteobacteria bacterium]